MNITKQDKKAKAIEILKTLDIYQPYIDGFRDEDLVCFFEHYAGYWVFQEPEIEAKMREIEEKYNCTVYAITHEFTDFGELYDFLIISDYEEEWDNLIYSVDNKHTAFAYVWNKSNEWCSEFGDIGVESAFGGIRRMA